MLISIWPLPRAPFSLSSLHQRGYLLLFEDHQLHSTSGNWKVQHKTCFAKLCSSNPHSTIYFSKMEHPRLLGSNLLISFSLTLIQFRYSFFEKSRIRSVCWCGLKLSQNNENLLRIFHCLIERLWNNLSVNWYSDQ